MNLRPILPASSIERSRATWQGCAEAIAAGHDAAGPRRFVSIYFRGVDVELYGSPEALRHAADELRALADEIEAGRP